MLASRRGHLKIAKLLLDKRVDPNAQNVVSIKLIVLRSYIMCH